MRKTAATSRAKEDPEHRDTRLTRKRETGATSRAEETAEHREARLQRKRKRSTQRTATEKFEQDATEFPHTATESSNTQQSSLALEGFNYNPNIPYSQHSKVNIGKLDTICNYCQAKKFKSESRGLCCKNGKIKINHIQTPPEQLLHYTSGETSESKHFLKHIRKYNSCFQMTSFGTTSEIQHTGFQPTFKVQGQIYHKVGSLLPLPEEPAKFLQLYFLGDEQLETDQRCAHISGTRRDIVLNLQRMLHEKNHLIHTFKTALERMPTDEYKVIIRADKTPAGEHERRFNAPQTNEVAVVISGDTFHPRDIIIQRRGETLKRIAETHRSYDALQYPLLLPYGEDGYNFSLRQVNPTTGTPTRKKISAMDFYAYIIMIRENQHNHILNCRQLFHQFIVDMYVKIESERLLYIRLNQRKLRAEQYIHLKDAVANDGNIADIGALVILPATFTGSPRHMHEYTQDAMTYVRTHGRPDLFITFTCNPTWTDIKDNLQNGQSPSDCHDLIARAFRQKQMKMI